MATETKNYHFVKPELTDDADIRVINTNFDRLDDMIFQSGDLGNHTGDQSAHDFLFAKYLPIAGGEMTGKLTGTSAEFKYSVKANQDVIFDDTKTSSLKNGQGQKYGASITFYGNDITSGYTGRKNNLWLQSAEGDGTHNCKLYLTPDMVTISTNKREAKYALNCPSIGSSTIYSLSNDLNFLESYNGNCAMQFRDLGKNQYIQIKVMDNIVKITNDGVYYNDIPSLFVEEYSEKTVDDYVVRNTRYNTGLMIIEYCLTGTKTVTFDTPFKDDNYVCIGGGYSDKTASGITITNDTILRGRWK